MGYEKLIEEASNIGLIVKEKDLRASDGLCKGKRIAIDKKLKTSREKYCVLAEEIGHAKLTHGNILNQNDVSNKKQELKARRWGYTHIVSIKKIIEAYENKCKDRYEMAEFIGVTDEYFECAINEYKKIYGVVYKYDRYHIVFEPNLGIYKTF